MTSELASLWTHRRALESLVRHDFRKTYASPRRGLLWTVLTPVAPIVLFSLVFAQGLRMHLGSAPYGLAFAAAYVPWVFLSAALTAAAGSLIEHRFLVKRVVFPIEIIPANSVLVQAFPHLVLIALTALACAVAGHGSFPGIVLLPYLFACGAALAVSAGLLLAALTVLVRDVQPILASTLQVWFWLTPIAWSASILPAPWRGLLVLNPASYLVSGYRHALLPQAFPMPSASEAGVFWLTVAAVALVAGSAFRRLRPHFWECL